MEVRTFAVCTAVGLLLAGGQVFAASGQDAAGQKTAGKAVFTVPSSARMPKGRPGQRLKPIDVAAQQRAAKRKELRAEEGSQLKALSRDRTLSRDEKLEKARQLKKETEEKLKAQMSPEELKSYQAAKDKEQALKAKQGKHKQKEKAPAK